MCPHCHNKPPTGNQIAVQVYSDLAMSRVVFCNSNCLRVWLQFNNFEVIAA
ncbi:hypothetical protein SEA_KEELAN_110 [Gordonia phage Keelan]|nr:hypothetical protein SEA_KEELAN_110 [Gordonia phage Keelan]